MLRYYADASPRSNQQHVLPHAGGIDACAMVGAVPDHFMFTLKSPKRITHDLRLRDAESNVAEFVRRAGAGRQARRVAVSVTVSQEGSTSTAEFLALLRPARAPRSSFA
jgi:hypothetical protein